MIMMCWINIDFIKRGERSRAPELHDINARDTAHRGNILCVWRLPGRDNAFVSQNRRAINLFVARIRESENGNPDAFCDMSRPCHKNRQNLIIDLTISVFCVWETSQIDPVQIDAIFRKNILNIRCCVNL